MNSSALTDLLSNVRGSAPESGQGDAPAGAGFWRWRWSPGGADWESLGLGGAVLLTLVWLAVHVVNRLHFFAGDAVARAFSAQAILLGSEPKLANVGFVWAPLPVLLQVPLLMLPALRNDGLAGNVLTALSGAGTALVLLLFMRRAGVPLLARWLLVGAYLLNPMVLLYSVNGMSEMVLLFLSVLALYLYRRWQASDRWSDLGAAGLAAGLACLARYDGVLLAAIMALVIGLQAVGRRPDNLHYAQSALLLFGAPVVYLGSLWIMANWMIMADPLFFVHSPLSLAARLPSLLAGREWIVALKDNVLASAGVSLGETWIVYPAFIVLSGLVLLLAMRRRSGRSIGVMLGAWALAAFSAANVYLGNSQFSERYFMSAIPMAFVLAAEVLALLPRWRMPVGLALGAGLLLSNLATAGAMTRPDPFDHDHDFLPALLSGRSTSIFHQERALAEFIDRETEGPILVDDFQGNQVMVFSDQPGRYIITSHSEFQAILREPFGKVDYLLVNRPQSYYVDMINRTYPELFESGGEGVELVQARGDWKMFRITGPLSLASSSDPQAARVRQ